MADETGQTKDTASVSPLSTNTPAWRPNEVPGETNIGSGNGATPSQTDAYGATTPDEAYETSSPLPLVIGLAAAGLATAGAVAFFVGRRAQNSGNNSTPLLTSDTLRNLTDSASDQLDDLRHTLKQQLVERPYRATRPLRRRDSAARPRRSAVAWTRFHARHATSSGTRAMCSARPNTAGSER